MALYKYKAIDQIGKKISGEISADNIDDVELKLRKINLELINTRKRRENKYFKFTGSKGLTRKERILFTFQLGQLINAGVPMLEGLIDLRESFSQPHLKTMLSGLVESIEGGDSLSKALAKYPNSFANVYVNLIKVGEESGELGEVLLELEEMLKWQDELVALTKQIIMYPAIIGILLVSAFIVLMIFVVPEMLTFISQFDSELPVYTLALLAVSEFMQSYWYLVILAPFVIVGSIKLLARSNPAFRLFIDRTKLKIWLIGPIMQKVKLARFSNNFALMYRAGITVLESLDVSKQLINNKALEKALEDAHLQITEGESISKAIENTNVFPPLVTRMFKVGEASGELDVALKNVKYYFDREVREALATIEPVLQPVLILVLAIMLVWIIASVFGPIYDTIGTLR